MKVRLALAAALGVATALVLRAQEPAPDPSLQLSKDRIRTALKTAEFDTARREAESLAARASSDAEAIALLGDALWATGLFDESDHAYARALTLDAAQLRARYGEARSLASRSQMTEALDRTRAILAEAPRESDFHALAASIQERMLRFDEAAASYDAYASLLAPDDTLAVSTARARANFLRSFSRRQPLLLDAKDAAAVHTVPFKLVRNKVVVQGRLNGQSVEWVVDTGAERTSVTAGLAATARVRSIAGTLTAGVGPAALRRVQLGRADTLDLGTLRVRNVPLTIRSPSVRGSQRWQGESLSPLALGLSLVVDYTRHVVILTRQLPEEAAEIRLPLRMQRLPFVRGTLNARHPAYFVVDTGGEVISISAETADALRMTPPRRIPLRVFGLSGIDDSAFLLPGVDLDFEEIEYRQIGLAVLNLRAPSVLLGFQVGGIVGHKFLGGYRVAFDVARSELRLSR